MFKTDRGTKSAITNVGWIKRHVIAHSVARSEVLYFLYPSLKFLSSQNLPRNFFSPSRGESKMFRLTKLKISTIFLNKSNFLNHKRLCFFASSHLFVFTSKSRLASSLPSCLAAKNPHLSKRNSVDALPPPRRQVLAQIQYFSALLLTSYTNFIIFFRVFQLYNKFLFNYFTKN